MIQLLVFFLYHLQNVTIIVTSIILDKYIYYILLKNSMNHGVAN